MMHSTRRASLKWLGAGVLAAGSSSVLPMTAAAETEEFVVGNEYQNFKRGTIVSLHPERRILNVT